MAEWVEFETDHARKIIAQNCRDQESWADPSFVDRWAETWRGKLKAYTLLENDMPVACVGLALQEWNKAEAWALFSPRFSDYTLTIYRMIKAGLKMVLSNGTKRVQAVIDADYPANVRWIESLGFELEGRMKKYGPQGQDFLMYARTN